MQYSKNVLKRLYYDYYFHRQENLWRQNALKTLPALLNSSEMLACGEDLGLIPSCVHPVCQLYSLSSHKQEPPSHSCARLLKHTDTCMFRIMLKTLKGFQLFHFGWCYIERFDYNLLVQVMQELGLVGLRIQRMPNESDLEFGIPSQYSYMTVNFIHTIAYPYFIL